MNIWEAAKLCFPLIPLRLGYLDSQHVVAWQSQQLGHVEINFPLNSVFCRKKRPTTLSYGNPHHSSAFRMSRKNSNFTWLLCYSYSTLLTINMAINYKVTSVKSADPRARSQDCCICQIRQ
jgi:hypothetical protein